MNSENKAEPVRTIIECLVLEPISMKRLFSSISLSKNPAMALDQG